MEADFWVDGAKAAAEAVRRERSASFIVVLLKLKM